MKSGIHAREKSGTDAGVFLNEANFNLVTKALGANSEVARSQLLTVDPKTIYLARRGGVVGEKFIANVLLVMRNRAAELTAVGITPGFDAVFEARERQVA
jgi:hypothetical protein